MSNELTAPVEATRVDPKLLEILVCPLTKGTLEYDSARQELISRSAKLAYRSATASRSCCRKRPGRWIEGVGHLPREKGGCRRLSLPLCGGGDARRRRIAPVPIGEADPAKRPSDFRSDPTA